jgi:hypothetical protein
MSTQAEARRPGQFAEERFRSWKRTWLKRIWWVFPVLVVYEMAIIVGFGLIVGRGHLGFFVGMGLGVSVTVVMCFSDSPPHYIERWRQGAEGEKRTAKALRRLTKSGWTLVHDIDQRWGNIDHVLIGPPGVFLLESKNLNGELRVQDAALVVNWREDPDGGYRNSRLAGRVRGASAELFRALQSPGSRRAWVQPVVVLWGRFEQRTVESGSVVWVHGDDLAEVLKQRPARLSPPEIAALSASLRRTIDPT